MKGRKSKGSAMVMVGSTTCVLTALGLGIVGLIFLFGGAAQLRNATDAGCLNVAKQLMKHPQVDLQQGKEDTLFNGFTDEDGKATLSSYNKIEGAALLIGLNAMEIKAHNSANVRAVAGAAEVAALVSEPTRGLGRRLTDAVNDNEHASGDFVSQAMTNSLRLLAIFGKELGIEDKSVNYTTAWMESDEACNVQLDKSKFPGFADADLATVNGSKYVKGYHPITLGAGLTYNFMSLFPGSHPHLISKSEFVGEKTTFTTCPANSIHGSGVIRSGEKHSPVVLGSDACAITGPTEPFIKPSLPSGYIIFKNPNSSGTMSGGIPIMSSIFNNQLMHKNGVYFGLDANDAVVAFTTDKKVMGEWAAHNAPPPSSGNETSSSSTEPAAADSTATPAPAAAAADTTTPPAIPVKGDNQIYLSDGNPISTAKIGPAAVMAKVRSVKRLVWDDTTNVLYTTMMGPMKKAYPPSTVYLPSAGGGLIALEQVKLATIELFNQLGAHSEASGKIPVPAASGLKIFDHDRAYSNECPFSHDGSPAELIEQICNPHPNYGPENDRAAHMMSAAFQARGDEGDNGFSGARYDHYVNLQPDDYTLTLRTKLRDRVRQIKPEATNAEIDACLQSNKLPLNSVLFLYMVDPKHTRKLVLTTAPPPALALAPGTAISSIPDGDTMPAFWIDYQPLWRAVNTVCDGGGEPVLFCGLPSREQAVTRDQALWTPSSGANGCLGMLEFQNKPAAPNNGTGVIDWFAPN